MALAPWGCCLQHFRGKKGCTWEEEEEKLPQGQSHAAVIITPVTGLPSLPSHQGLNKR